MMASSIVHGQNLRGRENMNIFILFISLYNCGKVGKGDTANGNRFAEYAQGKTFR